MVLRCKQLHVQPRAQVWVDMPAPSSGLTPVGEVRLVPDEATLRRLPWHTTHGIALTNMLKEPPPPDHAGDTGAAPARPDSCSCRAQHAPQRQLVFMAWIIKACV